MLTIISTWNFNSKLLIHPKIAERLCAVCSLCEQNLSQTSADIHVVHCCLSVDNISMFTDQVDSCLNLEMFWFPWNKPGIKLLC